MRLKELKKTIKEKRLFQWEIAKVIGISEFTLCRWLREELTSEREKKITDAIEKLTGEPFESPK